MKSKRLFEIFVQGRDCLPKDIIHKIQSSTHLVRDCRLDGAVAIGKPECRDLCVDSRTSLLSFTRSEPLTGNLFQQTGHTLDFGCHGPASSLCGMRGQHELNEEVIEQGLHLL